MEKAILFLDRNKLILYTTTKIGSLKLDFSPNVVDHLDIINEDELTKALKNFIESAKIPTFRLFVALSDSVIFDKSFEKKTDINSEEVIDTYIKNIPFEEVGTKIISSPKSTRVIAANADLYGKIVQEFLNHGFILDAVVPLTLLGKNIYAGGDLTPPAAQLILKKYDTFKQYSLTQVQTTDEDSLDEENESEKKKKQTMLIFLLPVMVILLGVLVFMILKSSSPPPEIKKKIETTMAPTSPMISPATSTESANVQDLTVQILNGSGVPGQADLVKNELLAIGFKTIRTGNAPGTPATKTIIIFTPEVPVSTHDAIVASLEKLFTTVSSQETKTSLYDIIITTGEPAQ